LNIAVRSAAEQGTCGAKEQVMNRDTLKGQWKQLEGEVKKRWGKFTDDDLTQMSGHYDKFVGKLQERYGYQRERAEKEIDDFLEKYPEPVTRP
jgi:uncharacterized protein YjbJ (UPF0337 family)